MMRVYLVALCLVLRVNGQPFQYMRPAPPATQRFVSFPTFSSNQPMNMLNSPVFRYISRPPGITKQFRTFQPGNMQAFSPLVQRISTFTPAAVTFPNSQITGQSSHMRQFASHGYPLVGSNTNLGFGGVSARALPPTRNGGTWKVAIPANFRSMITSAASSIGPSQSESLFTGQEGTGSTSESQFIGQAGASIGTSGDFTSRGFTDTGIVPNNGLTSDQVSISGNGVVDQSGSTGLADGFSITDFTSSSANNIRSDGFSGTDIAPSSVNNIGSDDFSGIDNTASAVNNISPEIQDANYSIKRKASSATESKARKRLELKMKLERLKEERAAKKAAKRAARKAAKKAKHSTSRVATASTILGPSSNRHGHTSFTQSSSTFSSKDISSLRSKLKSGEIQLTPQVLANLMSLGKSYGLDAKTTQEIITDLIKSMKAGTFNIRSSGFNAEEASSFKQLHEKSLLLLASIAAHDAQSQPSSSTSHSLRSTNHQSRGTQGGNTNNFINILMGLGSQNGNSQRSSSFGSSGMNAEVIALLSQMQQSSVNPAVGSVQDSRQNELIALLKQLQMSQAGLSTGSGSTLGSAGETADIQSLLNQLAGATQVTSSAQGSAGENSDLAALLGVLQRSQSGTSIRADAAKGIWEQQVLTDLLSRTGQETGINDHQHITNSQLNSNGRQQPSDINGHGSVQGSWSSTSSSSLNSGSTTGGSAGTAQVPDLGFQKGSSDVGGDLSALLTQLQLTQTGTSSTQGGTNEHQHITNSQLTSNGRQQPSDINGHGSVQGSWSSTSSSSLNSGSTLGASAGTAQVPDLGFQKGSSDVGGDLSALLTQLQLTQTGTSSTQGSQLGGTLPNANVQNGQIGLAAGSSTANSEAEIMKLFEQLSQSGDGQQSTRNGIISRVSTLSSGPTQGSISDGTGESSGNSIHGSSFWKSQSGSSSHADRNGHHASSTKHISTNHGSHQGLESTGNQGTVNIITSTFTSQTGASSPDSGRSLTQNSLSNLNAGTHQGTGRSPASSSSSLSKIYRQTISNSNKGKASAQSSSKSRSSNKSSRSSKSSRTSKSSKRSRSSSERKSSSSKKRRTNTSEEVMKRTNRRQGSSKYNEHILLYNKGQRKRVRLSDLETKLRPLVSQKSDGLSEKEIQKVIDDIVYKLRMESAKRMQNEEADSFHLESTTLDGNRHLEFGHPMVTRAGVSGFQKNEGGQSAISNFEPSSMLLSTLATLVNHRDGGGIAQGSTTGTASASETTNIAGADNSGAATGISKPSGFLDSFFPVTQGQTGPSADPQYAGKMSAAEAFRIAAMSSLIGGSSVPTTPTTGGQTANTNSGSKTITTVTSTTGTNSGSAAGATGGSPKITNSGSMTSHTSGTNKASTNTIGSLDLSSIGASEPTQQAKQTSNVNTHETIITQTGIETSRSSQGSGGGIGSLDLSGIGPTSNIPAASSNQANMASSTSTSQLERFITSQNNQGPAGTMGGQEQRSSSQTNMISSAGGPTSNQEPNPRPYRPSGTAAATGAIANQGKTQRASELIDLIIANEMDTRNSIGGSSANQGMSGSVGNQARNDRLASAITDMITSNNALPSDTHTTTSIKMTTKGNTGGLSAAEPIYTTNTGSGANGGAAQNTLDQTSRTAAALTDIITTANSPAGPNHSNNMASVLADLIATSPQYKQGTGTGGANTNSHRNVASMFASAHSSGTGHEMAGHGVTHNMAGAGANLNMAGGNLNTVGFRTNPDYNRAVSSTNGQATQGSPTPVV
ncbi:hornerin-like isoform X3 [Mizuhopecten yessoensis]|uniref:hornerin-like isoform X3 n=1 Tax=Mizuhopecten yessoensis TaxID=6573 RepID=UPI000B45A3A9|nr:hornerin-like isoform X3 [Mizuhopecten yessoensis]